jgi:hypothetical protein
MSGFVQTSLIRVDIQVLQFLESKRVGPTQTHNDVLRGIIGLPSSDEAGEDTTPEQSAGSDAPAAVESITPARKIEG